MKPGPKKGAPKAPGSGRKIGSQNKVTADIKAMILGALNKKGGQDWLEEQMEKNPAPFMTLLGKILPTQIQGDPDNPLEIVATITRRIMRDGKKD